MLKFIDDSSNNEFIRDDAGYKAIADVIDGVIIKISQGNNYVNPKASIDFENFNSLNKALSGYHYVDFFSSAESAHLISSFKGFLAQYDMQFVMVDLESATSIQSIANLPSFATQVQNELDVEVVVYCSYSNLALVRQHFSGRVIIADWENEITADELMTTEQNCIGVQYTDKTNINGCLFDEYDINITVAEKTPDVETPQEETQDASNIDITNLNPSVQPTPTVETTPVNPTPLPNEKTNQASTTPVLVTEIDTSGKLSFEQFIWKSDENGNSWIGLNIPYTQIISVIPQGSYPPIDGYWKLPKVGIQARTIDGFQTVITFSELEPNSEFGFIVEYYA